MMLFFPRIIARIIAASHFVNNLLVWQPSSISGERTRQSMMTFFFSMNETDCSSGCRWRTCPQRYLSALRRIDGLHNIRTLFGVHSCISPAPGRFPQNGDLIILYARDRQDLDAMIRAGDIFDGLKKILVLADPEGVDGRKYHMLAPRYITQAGRNIAELEAVINNIQKMHKIHKMQDFVH